MYSAYGFLGVGHILLRPRSDGSTGQVTYDAFDLNYSFSISDVTCTSTAAAQNEVLVWSCN